MNTITLPRGDWEMLTFALKGYIWEHRLEGGSMECILGNIYTQLDKQEH